MKVKLNADPERTVTIPLLKVNQGGPPALDYSNVPGDVTFNAGDTEKTFSFTAASDSDNDDGESVRISFGTLPDQVSAGTNSGTTVSITDDDVPSVTVSFETRYLRSDGERRYIHHGGGGKQGIGEGQPERRPRADGRRFPSSRPTRTGPATPTTAAFPRTSPSTAGTPKRPSSSPPPTMRRTTTTSR